MRVECKKNNEVDTSKLNELYSIFETNMKIVSEGTIYETIFTDDYKEKWIEDIKNNESMSILLFYNDINKIVGYLIIEDKDVNYVREFQIVEENRNEDLILDMAESLITYFNNGKDFVGRVWRDDLRGQLLFVQMGAVNNKKGELVLTNDKLKNWFDKKISES